MSGTQSSILNTGLGTVALRRHVPPSYVYWFDGSAYHADSMRGLSDYVDPSAPVVINKAFLAEIAAGRAGWHHFGGYDFPMGTASPAVTIGNLGGFTITGEGEGNLNSSPTSGISGYSYPATRFLAGANNQTLFKGPSSIGLQLYEMKKFAVESNGFTGITGVDLTSTEHSTQGSAIRDVHFDSTPTLGFIHPLILDGNDDLVLDNVSCGTFSKPCTQANSYDIQWTDPAGNIRMVNCSLFSNINIFGEAQTWHLFGTTFNSILTNFTTGGVKIIELINSYCNGGSNIAGYNNPVIDTTGTRVDLLKIDGGLLNQTSTSAPFFRTAGGFFNAVSLRNITLNASNSIALTDTPASFGRYKRDIGNVLSIGTINLAPFTVDGNGYLADPGYTTTTPTFPASGVDVQNTTGLPVIVYITGTGTGITAYGITDPAGTLISYTTTVNIGQFFILGTMAKIRFTFSGSPTWKWYGAS